MENPSSPAYQRLTGAGYRRLLPGWAIFLLFFVIGIFALLLRGRRVQLWLGPDHLLLVEWDGYKEYYKRFRFADIQGVTIRKTHERMAFNLLLALLIALLGLLAWTVEDPVGVGIFLGIAAVVFIVLVANTALGSTCQCYLRTAVQVEDLACLNRVPRARAALDRLRPLIQEAQGAWPQAQAAATPSPAPSVAPAGEQNAFSATSG
ncbi:MAG TPA: hypothetical protein PKX23_00990 [Verrucomicrobiota bacterium]|nr:hypothetical protein [Verrucomicrobiota bacterium]